MVMRPKSALNLVMSAAMPRLGPGATQTIKVGFLGPLSGNVAAWGEPGYNGCLIWADSLERRGGIRIGDQRFRVEIVAYDSEYDPAKAYLGMKKLILEDGVSFVMTLGGDCFAPAIQDFINQHKMLVSTLLPSDLSPNTPYVIAPCEIHPIYNVTGVEWLHEHRPELRSVAMCAQEDPLGLPSLATYRAAFEAAGIDLVAETLFPADTTDFSAIVDGLLAANPDILCWDTAYEPFVHALTEEAFNQGFRGQIISCTCDNYADLVERTSSTFMEGFVFQFPDFDDPALNDARVNIAEPNEFYAEFNRRFPHSWSAVSWEYAAILDQWKTAVEQARSFQPLTVLATMKAGGVGQHAFGEGQWWGRELFGIDNALVGDWPVVVIRQGKARIAEYRSTIDWWNRHGDLLVKHMRALGQMWDQREDAKPEALLGYVLAKR